jgi:uncharacterized protein
MFLKTFRWSFVLTAVALIAAYFYGGFDAALIVGMLIIIEIVLSFDNAILNTKVLKGIDSPFWTKMFLTFGIVFAVVIVRFLLPVILVSGATSIDPISVVNLAFQNGDPHTAGTYGYYVLASHPQLASITGVFLLMLFLNWLFGEKDHSWIAPLETPFEKLEHIAALPTIITLGVLLVFASLNPAHATTILFSGIIGMIASLGIDSLANVFGDDASGKVKAGFSGFLYLEALDASFSMDSVGGGIGVTSSIVLLMLGLGVGSIYVRSLTVYLMKSGSLSNYRHLESGAMWAIGALSVMLFISISTEIPELVTGGIGVGFVAAAIITSIIANKRDAKNGVELETVSV